jgi:acyl carrier protein
MPLRFSHATLNQGDYEMSSREEIRSMIHALISQLFDDKSLAVTDDTPLIGGESVLDSMRLVELCLMLEDRASELGFEFDWTSEAAMSRSRSMFRNAGSLANEFCNQMEATT